MAQRVKNKFKKMSKKKKILIIVLSVVLFLFVAVLCAGLGVLHWYCQPKEYTIVSASDISDENTKLIAHRGFSATAPENTLPSFENAGKNGFWGAECDVYRTSDGVWVIQHDINTYRMMDLTKNIEKCTYEELMEHNTDNGVNIDQYPDLKICTLDEYLECCSEYSMTAVIELKGKHNTEHYDEIVESVEKYGCDVIYISFHEECLEAMDELTQAKMFYLSDVVDEDAIEFAKSLNNECGIDFNVSKDENFEDDAAAIKAAQDEGLKLGAWTVDSKDTMKKLLSLGVNYITTNSIKPE